MAGQPAVACVGPSYALADRKAAVQRSLNLYMSEIEGDGEVRSVVLSSAPGLTSKIALGDTARGFYATDTRRFVVAGDTLYESTSGSLVSRGTLITSSGFVCMKHGSQQLVIVDGANGYVLNLSTHAFARITSDGWRGSTWVEELDGTFIFADPTLYTDQFYISAIDDGSSLNALDFSSADAQPDRIVTHRVSKQELFIFGTVSTEVWVYDGASDFPLVRYNSTPIDVGCVGNRAAIRAADSLFFVGQTTRGTGIVYTMVGHQPVRISTQAVEEAIQASTDLSSCSMWAYQRAGNEFIAVNAPGMSSTWCYDAAMKQWHERAELVDGEYASLRVDQVATIGNDHQAVAGSTLYSIDEDAYSIAGDPLVRERTWPHLISPSMEPLNFRGLELACTTGYGGNITLQISNDGGFNWGSPLIRSLGAVGQWMQRVRWMLLGSARDRVFRLRCTDAVPLTIQGANLDAQ